MEQERPPFKIVVLDDDPTGSQTVHGCPLLLRWDPETLLAGLQDPSPLLFLLSDSRALAPAAATARVRQICRALRPALVAAAIERPLIVSRGDSTLRGHFPREVEAIAAEWGPFDALFVVPAFLPGGRTTVAGVHRLQGVPVAETAFACDRLFGYRSSDLAAWVEEKSGGRWPAAAVQRLGLAELEAGGAPLRRRLEALRDQVCVVVDAERPAHLAALAAAVHALSGPRPGGAPGRPRRFLFQSAASLIDALAALPPQPRDAAGLAALRRRGPDGLPLPGLVLVGSHVPLADAQLACLLADPALAAVELEVAAVAAQLDAGLPAGQEAELLAAPLLEPLQAVLAAGRTPVLCTSRGELHCRDSGARRRLGQVLAAVGARLAALLAPRLGYLISKGGITSQTLLREGFGAARVQLQGQLLPGLSLVLVPEQAGLVPGAAGLPVLTFPGNLGDAQTLGQAWRLMQGGDR